MVTTTPSIQYPKDIPPHVIEIQSTMTSVAAIQDIPPDFLFVGAIIPEGR